MKRRGKKREIVFDPEARRAYLRGFSERKRQRRAYGLAMQKVKDRKAKIEERAQLKKDELKMVEEAEQKKSQYMTEAMQAAGLHEEIESDGGSDDNSSQGGDEQNDDSDHEQGGKHQSKNLLDTKTYDDQKTEAHWGGRVTVTTSVVDLGESSDDEKVPKKSFSSTQKSIDTAQKYAGDVGKYLNQLKGKMPGKKKNRDSTAGNTRRKGKNGAADMKGIGGAGNLKIAQKVLSKAKSKTVATQNKKRHGKRFRK